MALSSATLRNELENMTPTTTPGDSEAALANAYGDYIKQAVANAVPINAFSVGSFAIPAAIAYLTSNPFDPDDSSSQGAAKFVGAFQALWVPMVASPALYWVGATSITPPTFAGLASTLASVFDSNTSGFKSLMDSMKALAGPIHTATDGVGRVYFGFPNYPIT